MRIHKSDNHLNRQRCGPSKHFNQICKHPELGANGYFKVQIIEVLTINNRTDKMLLSREQFWQAQLFTLTHGMNSQEDWFSKERKGFRK